MCAGDSDFSTIRRRWGISLTLQCELFYFMQQGLIRAFEFTQVLEWITLKDLFCRRG